MASLNHAGHGAALSAVEVLTLWICHAPRRKLKQVPESTVDVCAVQHRYHHTCGAFLQKGLVQRRSIQGNPKSEKSQPGCRSLLQVPDGSHPKEDFSKSFGQFPMEHRDDISTAARNMLLLFEAYCVRLQVFGVALLGSCRSLP